MNYEELVSKGPIKHFKVSPSQVRNRIGLAKKGMKAARSMMDNVTGIGISYGL